MEVEEAASAERALQSRGRGERKQGDVWSEPAKLWNVLSV